LSPKGILLDYGETLVEEVRVDLRAGNAWLLSQAVDRPADLTLERVMERTSRVASQIAERRDRFGIETTCSLHHTLQG